jgi:hypothetical protein
MQPQGLEPATGTAPPDGIPRFLRLPPSSLDKVHTLVGAHAGVPKEAACIYTARSVTNWNHQRWNDWRALFSVPPTHTPEARLRRSQSRSVANRLIWQQRKRQGVPPPTHSEMAEEKRRQTRRLRQQRAAGERR